jgi:hypothetical protein
MQKDHAFVSSRIVWALRKHKLPGLHTALYDAAADLPQGLRTVADAGTIGTPVACCIQSREQWTLLGTEGIAGSIDGRRSYVSFADVRAVSTVKGLLRGDTAGSVKRNLANRPELRQLQITDQYGKRHTFQFATLEELVAFWNVLLRLTDTADRQVGLR